MSKCSIQIEWMTQQGDGPAKRNIRALLPDMQGQCAYLSEQEQGWVDRVDVSGDLVVYQLVHRVGQQGRDEVAPLRTFRLAFAEPALTVHSLHRGHGLPAPQQASADGPWAAGGELMRYGVQEQEVALPATREDLRMTALVVTGRGLRALVGEDTTQHLLSRLDLLETPHARLLPIPMVVSEPLRHCLASGCLGPLHSLYAKSKVLEFLWRLATFATSSQVSGAPGQRTVDTVQAVHDYVLQLEGAMPTLRELAQRFGESPQSLNKRFARTYGQTVYALLASHRLNQAHRALVEGGIPIKTLASRLGYSHVNHFTHAFKLKFGYTPGSLRRAA